MSRFCACSGQFAFSGELRACLYSTTWTRTRISTWFTNSREGNGPTDVSRLRTTKPSRLLVMYSSREFLVPPESFPEGVYPPPPWTLSLTASRDAYVEDLTAVFGRWVNHEAHSPPLYYGLAAVWYDLGRLVGLHGPYAAYWVRFLNIPLYVALIVAAYGFCRAYFSPTVALAVPALVAVFPSTVFFGINNDVLSPLMLLLALWLLLRWHAELASAWLSIAAGFAVSATVLVKLSNIAVLAACGVVALSGLYGAWKAGQFQAEMLPGFASARVCRRALGRLDAPQSTGPWRLDRRCGEDPPVRLASQAVGTTFRPSVVLRGRAADVLEHARQDFLRGRHELARPLGDGLLSLRNCLLPFACGPAHRARRDLDRPSRAGENALASCRER